MHHNNRDLNAQQHQDNVMTAAAKGAVAGLVGTAVLSLGMTYGPTLMEKYGLMPQQPDSNPPSGSGDGESGEPTENLVDLVTETVADTTLDPGPKVAAGQAVHWGYGATWGAIYGIAQSQLRLPVPLHGIVLGAIVGTVASTLVPAMHLAPSPTEQPMQQTAMMTGLHLLYGTTTAVVFDAVSS